MNSNIHWFFQQSSYFRSWLFDVLIDQLVGALGGPLDMQIDNSDRNQISFSFHIDTQMGQSWNTISSHPQSILHCFVNVMSRTYVKKLFGSSFRMVRAEHKRRFAFYIHIMFIFRPGTFGYSLPKAV